MLETPAGKKGALDVLLRKTLREVRSKSKTKAGFYNYEK
jgi:hypothetical protein